MSTVYFVDDSALWLCDIEIKDGVIKGYVINGHWHVTIDTVNKTVGVTEDEDKPRSYNLLYEVEVPTKMSDRDYNDVIAWAHEKHYGLL